MGDKKDATTEPEDDIAEAKGRANLSKYLALADVIDLDEGMVAYDRYNMVMRRIVRKYDERFSLEQVCAVFCSLSPNSDYWGNLRSTVSVLQGIVERKPEEDIVVSTYGHCKLRALDYARGVKDFERETKGPKVMAFYHNILTPHSSQWVTIDGHMVAIWRDDRNATMKESLISKRHYHIIATNVKELAFQNFMLPQQLQATLWFVRKRLCNVVYDPQLDLFAEAGDAWRTARSAEDIKPYTKRDAQIMREIESHQFLLPMGEANGRSQAI